MTDIGSPYRVTAQSKAVLRKTIVVTQEPLLDADIIAGAAFPAIRAAIPIEV
jgi:hypothetical protein